MDEQVINQASPDVTAEIKRKAQQMYFSGYKIAEIARQLDIGRVHDFQLERSRKMG